ncbi:Ig-like domain-containing protein [bacterium]|nr:Ig-like domain-containing protein [bacterium]
MTSFIPGVGQQLSIGGLITLIFNEAVKQTSLTNSIVLKQNTTVIPININVNEAGNIVTITAQSNLQEQLSYTLFVLTTLTDEAGNALALEKQITYFVNDTVIPEKPVILQLSQPAITQATEVIATVNGNYDTNVTKLQARKGNTVVVEVTPDESTVTLMTIPLELNKLNKFDIIAVRPSGNKSLAAPFSIVQDSIAPVTTILSPPDSITLPSDTVTLVASIKDASPISSALVNGVEKILNLDGNSLLNTVLTEIPNGFEVEIITTDVAGNTSTVTTTLSVSPEDPETETSPPIIAIISPEDGLDYDGSSIDVLGTVLDANDISMITINDQAVETPSTFPTAGSLFEGTLNNLVDGINIITVNAWDTKNNFAQASISINVDVAPPSLVILSPDNEAVFLSSNVTVSGVVTDSNGIASFTINEETVDLENDGAFSKLLNLAEGENAIVFRAIDLANNVVTKKWVLYYDVEGPEVSLIYPADGSTGVPSDTAIYVNFNERVNEATVSLNTIKVIELDDIGDEVKELTGNVVLQGGKMASFYPGIDLLTPGVSYRIKVLGGIEDLVGFELQSPQESTFTISEQVTTIFGMVIDLPTGKGLANVKVEIVGEDIKTITDQYGNYELASPRIPGGRIVLYYGADNAILSGESVSFKSTSVPIFIETNKVNNLESYTFLPRVVEESTEYITGVDDQIITFNDTIDGYTDTTPETPQPSRFSLTVPAGVLEFPNGSTSGELSACYASEQWLPVSTIENSGAHIPIISAVWFHPFGVKSSVPLEVSLPIPVDRGETGVAPGDRFFVVSYNSQTAEWEQVGVARVNDDASMFVIDPENETKGLTELTIAGIVPYAITPAVEEELSGLLPYIRPGTTAPGQNETEFFLIELMVALSIYCMMSPWSLLFWRVTSGPNDDPLAGVDVDFIGEHDISGWNGLVSDRHFFPIWPNLVVLMVFLSIEWWVSPEAQWSYTTTKFGGGVRKFPIMGFGQAHTVFSGNYINARNAPKIRFDSWSFHGNIRFIDGNGNPTTNPGIAQNPRIYIFSPDAGTLWAIGLGSVPAEKYPVESSYASEAPFNPDPNQKFYKSYDFILLAALQFGMYGFRRNTVEYEDPTGGGSQTYQLFRSHIIPGGNVRIMSFLKGSGGEVHVGEIWRKAPYPVVAGGDVAGMDIFGDLSIGKLNVDVFLSYTKRFDTPGQTPSITQGTVPDKGLVSHTSDRIQIVTSAGIHNGNKAPEGPWVLKMQVTSPAGNDIVGIGPNTAESWLRNSPLTTGKYTAKVSSSDDFSGEDLLSINLSANDTQSSAGSSSSQPTSTPPPITRPTAGRDTSTAGRYVQPRSETRSAARVTPAPPSNTDRKEYVWYVLPTLLYNIPTDTSNIKVTYNDWTAFAAQTGVGTQADLSLKPDDQVRDLMDATTGNKPLIYMNPSAQVTVKVEFKIQSYSIDDATAGPVFRVLQTGAPFLIGRPLKDNFANLLKQNATQTPSPNHQVYIQDATSINVESSAGQSVIRYPNYPATPSAVLIDMKNTGGGSTITIKTVPSATNVAADAIEISQYRNFTDTNLRAVLIRRKWQVEIIDRRTMIKNDTDEIQTAGTALDAIVNVLETIIIEAR